MGVEIRGERELLRRLEQRLGDRAAQKVHDHALKEGAKVFVKELKRQFETFKDKGFSIAEITVTGPVTFAGQRVMRVHWVGPHERYRIIHLNEKGTVKNPNPQGKGAIARALRNSEDSYRQAVKQAIEEGL